MNLYFDITKAEMILIQLTGLGLTSGDMSVFTMIVVYVSSLIGKLLFTPITETDYRSGITVNQIANLNQYLIHVVLSL